MATYPLPESLDDLRSLIEEATAAFFALQEQERQETDVARATIANAVAALEQLLGPTAPAPGTDSIRAVLAYGPETITANASTVVPLILQGMEILTNTLLAVAKVSASQID